MFSGGDPTALTTGSATLREVAGDIEQSAARVVQKGKAAAGPAGDGEVGGAIERATATVGGVLVASAGIATSMASGSTTAASQLRQATD